MNFNKKKISLHLDILDYKNNLQERKTIEVNSNLKISSELSSFFDNFNELILVQSGRKLEHEDTFLHQFVEDGSIIHVTTWEDKKVIVKVQ